MSKEQRIAKLMRQTKRELALQLVESQDANVRCRDRLRDRVQELADSTKQHEEDLLLAIEEHKKETVEWRNKCNEYQQLEKQAVAHAEHHRENAMQWQQKYKEAGKEFHASLNRAIVVTLVVATICGLAVIAASTYIFN